MLTWALTFLVILLVADVLGFGVVSGTAASIAQVLFFVFFAICGRLVHGAARIIGLINNTTRLGCCH